MSNVRIENKVGIALLALAAFAGEALATVAPPLNGGAGALPGGGDAAGGAATGGSGNFIFIMIGLFIVMMFMMSIPAKKEKKKMAAMMAALGRHDKVMTNGGIIGVITDIRDDEIVLKVDESTNTRIRFAKAAIKTVLKSAGQHETPENEELIDEHDEHDELEPAEVSKAS